MSEVMRRSGGWGGEESFLELDACNETGDKVPLGLQQMHTNWLFIGLSKIYPSSVHTT